MSSRRRSTALIGSLTAGLVAVSGLSLAVTGPAALADDTPGYSLRHISVDTLVGPNGDQPCTISADIYTPDGANRRHRKPAILTTHGFGGNKADANQTAVGRGFVREGYVVLSYSGLGFGGSGCKIRLDDPAWDGKAGSQVLDVLAGTRRFTDTDTGETGRLRYVARESKGDPKVGMIGGSYGGQVQYAVAMQDPRVDALIPIITWNDLEYSLAPNNTDLTGGVQTATPGVAKKQWTDLFFGAGIIDGVDDAQVDPTRNVGCPNFADEVCPTALKLNALGYPDADMRAIAERSSVAHYLDRITAPTLVVQGQRDTLFNLQEAAATYRGLKRQGTTVKMVWQSWGHSGSSPAPGELDFDAASLRDSYLGRRFVDWMDHHVRGDDSAPQGPAFAYFRDWVRYDTSPATAGTAVEKAYAEKKRFRQAPTASLFFTGDDGLTPSAGAVQKGQASYANAPGAPTSYSETSGLEGSQVRNPVSDAPGTFASFTSAPLAKGASIVGSPRLTLHLDAPVAAQTQAGGPLGQLVLFAKVYDVAPDGTPTLQHRLISPVRVGDVTRPVTVQLPGVVQRVRKGHRIQVVLAASDAAYANNDLVQPVTVTTSPQEPSVLRLPVLGDLTVQRGIS